MVQRVSGSGGRSIAVVVSRFGHDPIPVSIAAGTSVGTVLANAGIVLQDLETVYVAGGEVNQEDIVENGDVISIITPKAAGTRA